MKLPHLRSVPSCRAGFTLVELLVVIAIIAILAATTLGIAGNVIKYAKRAKASSTAVQIQTACLAYYTEYSVYPVPTGDTGAQSFIGDSGSTYGTAWATLICVLSGNIHPSTGGAFTAVAAGPTNTRGIAFLTMKTSDVFTAADVTANSNATQDAPKNPLPSSTSLNLFYNIVMDADYCGVIGVSPSTYTTLPNFVATSAGGPPITSGTPGTATGTATSTAGVAVWADCNGSTSLNAASAYVHTY